MLDTKQAIKHLMIDRHMKVGSLATQLEMNPRALSNWLAKPDIPRINTIENILAELGCHLAIVDDKSGEILF